MVEYVPHDPLKHVTIVPATTAHTYAQNVFLEATATNLTNEIFYPVSVAKMNADGVSSFTVTLTYTTSLFSSVVIV